MPAGRPTKYKPEYCEAIVEHMAEGASVASFAAEIDVSRATINVWAEQHPEFLDALNRGKAKCAAWWEKTGRMLAQTGQGSAPMTIFGLRNMAAEDWKERKEVDHQSSDGSMTPKAPVYKIVDE